jgi:hypothetical protein
MKKSLEEIKDLSKAGNKVDLILNIEDYEFIELLDIAKISGLIGWGITLTNCKKMHNKELIELLKHSEDLIFDLR